MKRVRNPIMGSFRFHHSAFSLALTVTISLIQISHCHGSICLPRIHAPLFIFGDSNFDAGNNNYINTIPAGRANFAPYGETFFKYPTGRYSDGRVIPDFIAEFAKLPLLPPYLHPGYHAQHIFGVNFASAGSGVLPEINKGLVVDLKTQFNYFKNVSNVLREEVGDAEGKALVSKAVYLFSVGGNDYSAPFMANPNAHLPYTQQQYVDLVIGNLTTVIKEIYNVGGRKFGFLNLGPYGCLPVLKILVNGSTGACFEQVNELARLHNDALQKMLQKLEKQLKGFRYSITDFYSEFIHVQKHSSKYGFKEVDVACCGGGPYRGNPSCGGKRGIKEYELCKNVSEYLLFDNAHLTDRAAQHFAQLMWSGNHNVKPYNLKTLFEMHSIKTLMLAK